MHHHQHIARRTAEALSRSELPSHFGVLGFDGFVDDIIDVVEQRHSPDRYERIATMGGFGTLIQSAAGQGCNVELVVKRQKLGGNAPIMGHAMATLGLPLACMGALGDDGDWARVHPVFAEFAKRATLIPLTRTARTHALEFTDGKLMMGELASLSELTFEAVVKKVGLERLVGLFEKSTMIGLLNWTMLPHSTTLWEGIGREILPRLSKKPRRVFVDLADPKKRPHDEIVRMGEVLTVLNRQTAVTLGLNEPESRQVAAACGVAITGTTMELAARIRERLVLDTVVIHLTDRAAGATREDVAEFPGPLCAEPKILTGAGDHFNAGFATGQLLGLPLEGALCLGTATSGYYVRRAESPSASELIKFLEFIGGQL